MATPTVEDHQHDCIDAAELNRRCDLLHNGTMELAAGLKWPQVERLFLDRRGIQVLLKSGRQQVITITWARNLNGYRPWLNCPECERRVARVFMDCGRYACRWCHGWVYQCQATSSKRRIKAKLDRIHRLLGHRPWQRTIRRPEYMSRKVFRRLQRQVNHLHRMLERYPRNPMIEAQWDEALR
jgi:hypothetical protein